MRRACSNANKNHSSDTEEELVSSSDSEAETIMKKANRVKNRKSHCHYTLREDTLDNKDPKTRSAAICRRVRVKNSYRQHILREDTSEEDELEIKSINCRMVTLKIL